MKIDLEAILDRMCATMVESGSEATSTAMTNTLGFESEDGTQYVARVNCTVEMARADMTEGGGCQCGDGCDCGDEQPTEEEIEELAQLELKVKKELEKRANAKSKAKGKARK